MSSTPFRTAFWALGLALAMTVMLGVPDPERLRMALRLNQFLPDASDESLLIAAIEASDPGGAKLVAEQVEQALIVPRDSAVAGRQARPRESTPQVAPPFPTGPLMVASADTNQSLNLSEEAPKPKRTPRSRPAPSWLPPSSSQSVQDIPVPEPQLPDASKEAIRNTTPIRTAAVDSPYVKDSRSSSSANQDSSPVAPEPPHSRSAGASSKNETSTNSAHSENLAAGITVSSGDQPNTLSFRFRSAQLNDVFHTLGAHAGWNVIVDSDVTGSFSGELRNVEPSQAFAVLIKMHHCSITRRGNAIMVSLRPMRGPYR